MGLSDIKLIRVYFPIYKFQWINVRPLKIWLFTQKRNKKKKSLE